MITMPEYKVLNSSDDIIPVCNLLCWDAEESKLVVIKVKGMNGEDGEALKDAIINISTTNKEVIPEDIAIMQLVDA